MKSLQDIRFLTRNRNLSIFLFFLFIYFAICSGHIGGDGLWIYFSAESLVTDGDLNIINLPSDFSVKELRSNYDNFQQIAEKIKSDGGTVLYSQYGLMMSLLYAVFYSIGYAVQFLVPGIGSDYITIFFVSLANCFITALCLFYFYRFARDITGSEKRAVLLSCVFGFGTFVVEFAIKSGFSEPTYGLTIFASFYHAYRYKNTLEKRHLRYSGLFGAAALLTKFYSFMALGVISVYVLWIFIQNRDEDQGMSSGISKTILYYIVPLIVGLGLFIAFNYDHYGGILDRGYSDLYTQNTLFDFSVPNILARSFNLLVSPGKGILIFAPAVFLSIKGLRAMFRSHRDESILCFLIIFIHYAFFSAYVLWHGDDSWGPRYLYIIVPFLILPVASLLNVNMDRRWMRYVQILFIAGIAVQLPAVINNNSDFIRFSKKAGFESYRHSLPQYSPVVIGYFSLASSFSKLFYGQSMTYPVIFKDVGDVRVFTPDFYAPYKTNLDHVSLIGYDNFDLWIAHVWRITGDSLIIKLILSLLCIVSVLLPVAWYRMFIRNLE